MGTGQSKQSYFDSLTPVSKNLSDPEILVQAWKKALGVQGRDSCSSSSEVRAYKKSEPKKVALQEAREQAMATLSGFIPLFDSPLVRRLPTARWAEPIADFACSVARESGGTVSKGKGFDDPIESGIALLTGIAFLVGNFHAWGDGSHGTVVGPGRFAR
jgi:hypothetical protein